ncbi:MAG: DNA polymerase domain-containing protein [Candidatus Nanoarchaeia archaeon]
MQTTFTPIDYDYFDFNGKNYAKIIGRDSKGKRVCIIDSCPVYLWVILKEGVNEHKIKKITEKIKKIKIHSAGRETTIEKIEVHNKNFLGKPVKALKVFATNYKDLHDVADKIDFPEVANRRGYDLGFITHYIIEKNLIPLNTYEISGQMLNNSEEFGGIDQKLDVDFCVKTEKIEKANKQTPLKPLSVAYDIETNDLGIGKGDILMVSLVSSDGLKKVITWKKDKSSSKLPSYVEYVESESELIETFCKYIKKISPDFLIGYNSDGFDLPYFKSRAEKHKIKLTLGLDNSQPRFSGPGGARGSSGKIKGIVHIDIFRFIKTAYSQYMQSETLSLNEVSKEFLGDSKKDFNHRHATNLRGVNWKDYYEYNLHDSVLTLGLFEKFWPDIQEFSKTIQEPPHDTSRYGLSRVLESYILHNLNKFNEIPEKRPTHDEIGKRRIMGPVEGAFVFQPKPGLYEDIVMFDFTSMHTSIIISMNLSKATLLSKKEKNSIQSPELELTGKHRQFYFDKEPGFFPEMMKEIFELRKKAKTEYKKNPNPITLARSNAFKVLSASAHGYVAFFGARYHSKEASASILAFVRKFNKDTISKVEKSGFKVIYADTDSVAFTRKKHSKQEIQKLLKKLNSELPGVMELELEDFYKRGIWVTKRSGDFGAKKKYALLDEKGKLKVRGFETVRRDWCKLARDVQNQVIKQILQEGNEKKSLEYVKKIIKQVKKREIAKEDMIIKTQLKKPLSEYKAISPHVIAARKMKEKKIPITQGGLIHYFIAETKPGSKTKLVRDKVKLPEEKGEYNIKYYLERQILPAVENIFQVFNINITEIIDGKKQTTLGDF